VRPDSGAATVVTATAHVVRPATGVDPDVSSYFKWFREVGPLPGWEERLADFRRWTR